MKRNILIFAALALTLLLSVSCNREYKYEPTTYATLYTTSFSFDETVGEVKVPVLLNNPTGKEVQIAIKLIPDSAEKDIDYELTSPENGILKFSGDTDSLAVVIGINSFEGTFTGGKSFSMEISSLTDGVSVGNISTAKFSIKDLDHPLTFLMGTWTGTLIDAFEGYEIPTELTISEDTEDPTYKNVVVEGLDPMNGDFAEAIIGTYNSETKEIVFAAKQTLVTPPEGYEVGLLMGWNETFSELNKDMIMIYKEADKTLAITNPYGAWLESTGLDPKQAGFYSLYMNKAVFSKQ